MSVTTFSFSQLYCRYVSPATFIVEASELHGTDPKVRDDPVQEVRKLVLTDWSQLDQETAEDRLRNVVRFLKKPTAQNLVDLLDNLNPSAFCVQFRSELEPDSHLRTPSKVRGPRKLREFFTSLATHMRKNARL